MPPKACEERGLVPGGRIGGYVIDELITGLGDLFAVFNAHDEASGRLVALKVEDPEPGWPEQSKAQFLRTVQAIMSVAEPHVLPVYAAGKAAPSPPPSWADEQPPSYSPRKAATPLLYVASQFVFGPSLASQLENGNGLLAIDRVLAITAQVASALDAAHAAGVVHHGVKPGNILLSTFPRQPERVYLTDFGVAKARADNVHARGARDPEWSPPRPLLDYFAPEQILGEHAGAPADQYSLACVAFHMLASFAPFVRPDWADTAHGHIKGTLPSLPAYRPDLPFAVDDVFVRAMAKDAGDRYQSCGAFAAALRACVA
jgi:serine/threonine protein kinase